jgi:hypothetical protein
LKLYFSQRFSKIQAFWLNRNEFLKFDEKIKKFHESAWNKKSSEIYEKYANYCLIAGKFINFLYVGVGVVTFSNPIFVKLLTGKLVLPYGFKMPLLNELSFVGYPINLLYHLFEVYIVAFAFIYTDGLFLVIIMHVYCVYDNLCLMLDELNEDLCDELKRKSPNIRDKLVEIIKMHQELLRLS